MTAECHALELNAQVPKLSPHAPARLPLIAAVHRYLPAPPVPLFKYTGRKRPSALAEKDRDMLISNLHLTIGREGGGPPLRF
jgi:hypothetical protein